MEKLPLVTIVTPSYQQANYLEETILSVLNQDYPNIEYIIIDGGSTDGSIDIIRKYEAHLAFWVSEPDKGQADAINKGWLRSKGDFLGWLNSDDLLVEGAITEIVNHFAHHPDIDFVYGDLIHIDEFGNKVTDVKVNDFDIKTLIQKAGWISQPGNIFRRSIIEKIGMLDASLNFQMDLDFWIRAGLICNFAHLRVPLAKFRLHSNSKTSSKSYLAAQDIIYIYNKLFSRSDLPNEIIEIKKEGWSNAYLYSSRAWLGSNNLNMAKNELYRAVKLYPPVTLTVSFIKHFFLILIGFLLGIKVARWIQQI